MGVIMKSTTVKLFGYSFLIIGILVLKLLYDPLVLYAATEKTDLSVDQILDRVEDKYTNSKFAADFIQKSTIKAPQDNQVMTGKAPTFFRDGKGASFLSDIRLIRQKFDIVLEQGPPEESDLFHHLILKPREKTLDISEIRLMVSRQTFNVLQVMTLNFYGDETRIDLINFAFGVDMDDSLFSFTIPQGVDVLQIDE
jgi:hypothetical protein